MSNDYTIYNRLNIELSILETSNNLSLVLFDKMKKECVTIQDYTDPKELMQIFLKGITACSYWMHDKEFKETLNTLEDYSI